MSTILSQFFIASYTGKQPLSLMTMPEDLSDAQKIEYDKFIQSVSTIYASQSSSNDNAVEGTIPKFWTVPKLVDRGGNKVYIYQPSPDSTLTQLNSKESYYFIVRDAGDVPLSIPLIGGSTDSSTLFPNINTKNLNYTLTETSGNTVTLSAAVSGLQLNTEYNYSFECLDSNWPIQLGITSGNLISSFTTSNISTILNFLPTNSSTNCNSITSNVFPAYRTSTGTNKKYATIRVSIQPKTNPTNTIIYSDAFTLTCSDCLPKVRLSTSSPNMNLNSIVSVTGTISNVSINKQYSYTVNSINSEWPAFVNPISGIIYVDQNPFNFSFNIIPCASQEICPTGLIGVPDYTIPSTTVSQQPWYKLSTSIYATVYDTECIDTNYSSNILKITCGDCVAPKVITEDAVAGTSNRFGVNLNVTDSSSC